MCRDGGIWVIIHIHWREIVLRCEVRDETFRKMRELPCKALVTSKIILFFLFKTVLGLQAVLDPTWKKANPNDTMFFRIKIHVVPQAEGQEGQQ